MTHLRTLTIISLLTLLTGLFSQCIHDRGFTANDPRGEAYAGAAVCAPDFFNLAAPSCIDCHMPLQNSKTIHAMGWTGGITGADSSESRELKNIPYLLRTHKIAVYKAKNL